MPHPWGTGDLERNWQGYFIPGTSILRNRVGAQTYEGLRDAENDLVEARVIELREAPDLLGDRTYDLTFPRAIHRRLFQDVYVWAGDVRTVGIEKEGESFCPPGNVGQPMTHVAAEVHRLHQLKTFPRPTSRQPSAYLYDYANFAHPFREGNGRCTESSLTSSSPRADAASTGRRLI